MKKLLLILRIVCAFAIFGLMVDNSFGQGKRYELRIGGGTVLGLNPEDIAKFYDRGSGGVPLGRIAQPDPIDESPPIVDDTNIFDRGFNIGGSIGFYVKPQLTISGEFSYNRFNLDKDKTKVGVVSDPGEPATVFLSIEGGSITLVEILGVMKYYLRPLKSSANIYVLWGVGTGITTVSDSELLRSMVGVPGKTSVLEFHGDSETNAMVTVGVGAKFGPITSFFVESRLNAVFTEDAVTFFPLRAGVVF